MGGLNLKDTSWSICEPFMKGGLTRMWQLAVWSLVGGSSLCRGDVAEGEVRLEVLHWLAVDLGIRVDEIVEGIAFLVGRKVNVAAVGEENTVNVVRAEEVIVLGGIFPGFGGINGHPADAIEIKLGPAVIARNVAFGFAFGQGKTDFEARGNAGRAHHTDEKGMEVGTVAALRSASPNGVAAAPAFAGFVVAHGGDDVFVDVSGFFDLRGVACGVLLGKLSDRAI